jgi:hypothetical protein
MQQEIVLTQGSNGEWEMETLGFVDSACEQLGNEVADLLGETTGVNFKPEHGLTPPSQVRSQQVTRTQRIQGKI